MLTGKVEKKKSNEGAYVRRGGLITGIKRNISKRVIGVLIEIEFSYPGFKLSSKSPR